MLAARARGLGTCMDDASPLPRAGAAEILGIPDDKIMQTALLPVAYSIGTEFKPARAASRSGRWRDWDSW